MSRRRLPQIVFVAIVALVGIATQAQAAEQQLTLGGKKKLRTNDTPKPLTSETAKPLETPKPPPFTPGKKLTVEAIQNLDKPSERELAAKADPELERMKKLVEKNDKTCYEPKVLEKKAEMLRRKEWTDIAQTGHSNLEPTAEERQLAFKTDTVAGTAASIGAQVQVGPLAGAQISATKIQDQDGSHTIYQAYIRVGNHQLTLDNQGPTALRQETATIPVNRASWGAQASATGAVIIRNPGSTATATDIYNNQLLSGSYGWAGASEGKDGGVLSFGPQVGGLSGKK